MPALVDLAGSKFGRLTVLERIGTYKNGNAVWLCKCSCGNKKNVLGGSLRKGVILLIIVDG